MSPKFPTSTPGGRRYAALQAFQSFVQSMVIPSGVCVERLRAHKGGEFIGNDVKDYCT